MLAAVVAGHLLVALLAQGALVAAVLAVLT
jgi:hypothetical protein